MKQLAYLVLISIVLFSYSDGHARNTHLKVSISEALELGEREGRLDNSIRLYFGSQRHPAIQRRLGTYTSVKKTNGVGKNEFSSTTDFECGAGAVIAGVTLIGDVVKIAN